MHPVPGTRDLKPPEMGRFFHGDDHRNSLIDVTQKQLEIRNFMECHSSLMEMIIVCFPMEYPI